MEKTAASLYAKYLRETSFLSEEFLLQDKERIKMILENLLQEAEKHCLDFEKLLQKTQGSLG